MSKDFSNNSHWYSPAFNTNQDRKRDPAGPTHIYWDNTQQKYITVPGPLPSKRKSNGGSRSRKRAERLAKRDGGWKCFWCDCELSYEVPGGDIPANLYTLIRYPTIDHVIELANGGPDTDDNCVLACRVCNNSRNKTFHERGPDKQ